MIYNLYAYVKAETGFSISVNGVDKKSTDTQLRLNLTGGDDTDHGIKSTDSVQFISQSSERVESERLIQVVFNLLKHRFGVVLPEITVKGTVYPAVKVYQLAPKQRPGYIGSTENGLHMWSVNFQVITGGN